MIKDTNDETIALARIQACIDELKAWMIHHRLQLNDSKTEILVITTPSSAGKHNLTDVVIGDSILNIHRIRAIRDCLTQHATELLVHALVISRLDYGSSLLYGLPDLLLDKLQRAQNAAARVVVKASRYDHVTPIRETLHWLPRAISYLIQDNNYNVQSQSSTCA